METVAQKQPAEEIFAEHNSKKKTEENLQSPENDIGENLIPTNSNIELDKHQLFFHSQPNQIAYDTVIIKNTGQTCVYYQWVKTSNSFQLEDKRNDGMDRFFCHYGEDKIYPEEEKEFTFSFFSEKNGVFSEEWGLITTPPLPDCDLNLHLNGVVHKYEVRLFFQNILQPIITQLIIKRNEKWSFNVDLIKKFISETLEETEGTSIYEKDQKKLFHTIRNTFYKNYLPSLDDKYLEKYKNQCENNIIKEYCDKQLKENDSNRKFVSSTHFIELIYKEENAEEILNLYIKCFMSVQRILIAIFKKLSDNSQAMPYIIRCICKMIKCIIKKKFPDASTMDVYKFVAKFFFKIFNRYLKTFDTEIFIDLIIDEQLTEKINIITVLINMIIKGDLFNNKSTINYIPFNWFLIKELMPIFYDFFEKLTNFQFSPYIEKLVTGLIDIDNMIYDYFVENPDKHFRYFNICLTVADYVEILNVLVKLRTDNPDIFKLNEKYLINFDEKTKKILNLKEIK